MLRNDGTHSTRFYRQFGYMERFHYVKLYQKLYSSRSFKNISFFAASRCIQHVAGQQQTEGAQCSDTPLPTFHRILEAQRVERRNLTLRFVSKPQVVGTCYIYSRTLVPLSHYRPKTLDNPKVKRLFVQQLQPVRKNQLRTFTLNTHVYIECVMMVLKQM